MGVSYKPSLKEYCSILKDYAISGIASYDSLDSATRLRVERSLGRRIESRANPPFASCASNASRSLLGAKIAYTPCDGIAPDVRRNARDFGELPVHRVGRQSLLAWMRQAPRP